MSTIVTRTFGAQVLVSDFADLGTMAAFSTETWEFVTWSIGNSAPAYERAVHNELRAMALRITAEKKAGAA